MIWTTKPDDRVDGAGGHRGRRRDAEPLEEAHVDRDPGRRARDRQVDVADGELQRGERSERQRVLERAHRADGRREPWDLRQHEGERQPPPRRVAQRLGERLEVHVAERADERVRGEGEQRQVEQRADRDPAQLDELLLGRAERRPHAVADVVELDVRCRRARRADAAGQGGRLEVRQHREHAARRRADRRAAATARSSPTSTMPRASAWASSRRRSATVSATNADDRSPNPIEPSSRWTSRSRSSRWWAMPAACSRRRSAHRRVERGVADGGGVGRAGARRAARRRARRPDRPLPAVTSRGTRTPARSASSVTKPSCSTSSSRLRRTRPLRPAVPRQAPEVRQQLGVPRVAAVDLDVERSGRVASPWSARRPRRASWAASPRRRRRRARAAPARSATSSAGRRASRRRGGRRPRRACRPPARRRSRSGSPRRGTSCRRPPRRGATGRGGGTVG